MPIDFGLLQGPSTSGPLIHPRDVFSALPSRPTGMDYLRGPQDQVLEQWFSRRETADLIIKMNTGGGKTLVGLLIARSALAEHNEPVAFLAPDHYLAQHIVKAASELGVETTRDPRSHLYAQGSAVLVDTFQRVFNGMSIFGVETSSGRSAEVPTPTTLIIDDAHACLNTAAQASRIVVPRSHSAYGQLLDICRDALEQQSPAGYLDLASDRPRGVQQVPFWAWAERSAQIMAVLHKASDDDALKFEWPLLVDVLEMSRAVFTSRGLEIEAPCLPTQVVTGLSRAKRRVYLTATLANDGALVTDFGADPDSVADPITPASAGDIGDRLILIPEQTHPDSSAAEIRDLILDLSKTQTVVVIVPSKARAAYWQPHASLVLDKDSIEAGVAAMRSDPNLGLVVLINRYDGIDLAGDSCHVLVVDGLPEALSGVDQVHQTQLLGSGSLLARQVQRLEQGMGRATRSNDDYCVVFLLGARLAQRLHGAQARSYFSPATRAQLELSEQLATQFDSSQLSDLQDVAHRCLARDPQWVSASRAALAPLKFAAPNLSAPALGKRHAFAQAAAGDYARAASTLRSALAGAPDDVERGYLLQQVAAYEHFVDPARSQQTQKAANAMNRNLLRPIAGVKYERLPVPTQDQGAAAAAYLQGRYSSANELTLGLNGLRSDLSFGPETDAFERAWSDLAWHLGHGGQRPELDTGRGPDGLWSLSDGTFLVCEAKSGVSEGRPVFKKDAEQLSNAMDWFRGEYTTAATGIPVLIHPDHRFDRQAAVPTYCRVITPDKLAQIRKAIAALSVSLAHEDAFRDGTRVAKLLASHGFIGKEFLKRYSKHAAPGA